MLVLDSSALIEISRQGPRAEALLEKTGTASIVTTSVTMHEMLYGARTEKERWILDHLFSACEVLPFDSAAASKSSVVAQKMKSKSINDADILIAGICLANNATLVTFDNDFKRVPGLKTLGI